MIVNKYDLMDTIDIANQNIEFKKILLRIAKLYALPLTAGGIVDVLTRTGGENYLSESSFLLLTAMIVVAHGSSQYYVEKRDKVARGQNADWLLSHLALRLADLNISTTAELLMQSKLDGKPNSRLFVNNSFAPTVTKYILVPDRHNIYREIKQEHGILSNEYIISAGGRPKEYEKVKK